MGTGYRAVRILNERRHTDARIDLTEHDAGVCTHIDDVDNIAACAAVAKHLAARNTRALKAVGSLSP